MRVFLLTLLGLFLLLNIAGAFLPQHTEVAESRDARVAIERLHELASDLARWPVWSPAFEAGEAHTLEVVPGHSTTGAGGSTTLLFDGKYKVLFLVADDDAERGVTMEVRVGMLDDDLVAGSGTRAWERIEWESLGDGEVRVTWTRTGSDLDLFLLRLWDRWVLAPKVRAQVGAGLDALIEAAQAPASAAASSGDSADASR